MLNRGGEEIADCGLRIVLALWWRIVGAAMIRHPRGNEWLLFTQHDHALLAGRLAEQFGAGEFARGSAETIQGVALHDCGWPLHDDRPTLNERGEPLHVFESPVWVGCMVWSASARRA